MERNAIYLAAYPTLTWRGHLIWKNVTDLFIYAEIVHEVRPTLIIETGTYTGASALYWADMLRLNDIDGHVLTTDIYLPSENPALMRDTPEWKGTIELPVDERITYMNLSSTSPEFLEIAHERAQGQKVLINLDSYHGYENVRAELDLLHPLVSAGSYLIVEDGVGDLLYDHRGPLAASRDFLHEHPEFSADRTRERLEFTNCVEGYLYRDFTPAVDVGEWESEGGQL